MTVVVCMQPTFVPWAGFFDLIAQSDHFVFLDDVQFSKQSWQQRNRIRTNKNLEWLTVPVRVKGRSGQLINEVEIDQGVNFPRKILRAIEMNYGHAEYFEKYFVSLENILSQNTMLCEMNIALTEYIAKELGISNKLIKNSELCVSGSRSSRLINICKELGAGTYLSAKGASEYLTQDIGLFRNKCIKVLLHNYEHPVYNQQYFPFIPYASVIDLLFNEGDMSAEIMRSGRRMSCAMEPKCYEY